MEELKNDIEQVKVQFLTGIKLGRVDEEWGNMIIETCNRALTIPVVVGQSEQLKPKEQICYKSNEPCKYDCSGLCKESC